jgi:hypothetical protein
MCLTKRAPSRPPDCSLWRSQSAGGGEKEIGWSSQLNSSGAGSSAAQSMALFRTDSGAFSALSEQPSARTNRTNRTNVSAFGRRERDTAISTRMVTQTFVSTPPSGRLRRESPRAKSQSIAASPGVMRFRPVLIRRSRIGNRGVVRAGNAPGFDSAGICRRAFRPKSGVPIFLGCIRFSIARRSSC